MITITIDTQNAAFAGNKRGDEVARILRGIADAYYGWGNVKKNGPIRDSNGNAVGMLVDDGPDAE